MVAAQSAEGVSRRVGLLLTTFVNGATLLIGLVTGVVTARAFDPADRGQFLAVVLWSGTVAAFSLLGLDQALVFGAKGNARRALGLTDLLARRVFGTTTAGTGISFGMNLLLLERITLETVTIAGVGALPVLFNGMTQMRLAPLLIAERYVAWNLARLASPISYVLVLGALFASGSLTMLSAVGAASLGSLASLVLSAIATRGRTPKTGTDDFARLVLYGTQTLLISIPSFMASRVDQLLMGLLAAPATLGIYAVSVSVASVMEVFKQTIEQLAFPHFARAGWERSRLRLRAVAVTLLAVGASGVLLALAHPLLPVVYGEGYQRALEPLPWLLSAVALRVGVSYMGAAARASGQLRMMAKSQGLGLAFTSAALVVLLPWRGAQGAAEAVLAGQFVNWVTMFHGLPQSGLAPAAAGEESSDGRAA
jgi:O-antigen/teichoic acid export membrane protein